ncbi:MAG: cob(I)yrinic acid a,c-diamide adenosyltransferase [Neptuniibacter sp.]
MSNRLTKIYTRSGDQGDTGLANGSRINKSSLRIETLGTVDELNSWIGIALSNINQSALAPTLRNIQHQLFDLGGEIAVSDTDYRVIDKSDIDCLEQRLDHFNEKLPALEEFILPGGSTEVCNIHLARTVCRRAERVIIALNLSDSETVNPYAIAYLNRLSDLLFVAARFLAAEKGEGEVLWKPKTNRKTTER